MKLNPQSPVPLYHQLQEILRQKIAAKAFAVGAQIPSEHELCAAYGVTRPTVRQALEGLVREGLLMKRRGKGAFVTEPPVPVGMFSVAGTSEAFAAQKLKVETRLLHAGPAAACVLADGDDPAAGWIKLERVRSLNGAPTFFEFTWIDRALVPGLEDCQLNNRSLYRTLQEKYSLRTGAGRQRFAGVAAGVKVARALRVRPGAPLLRVVRTLDLIRGGAVDEVHRNAFRVDLYAAQGPFVLEQAITASNAAASAPEHPEVAIVTNEQAGSLTSHALGALV